MGSRAHTAPAAWINQPLITPAPARRRPTARRINRLVCPLEREGGALKERLSAALKEIIDQPFDSGNTLAGPPLPVRELAWEDAAWDHCER